MKTKSYIKMIMSLLFIILIFSCSSSEDKRKTLIKAYGEPDIIEKGGYGTLKYQLFIYLRKDLNRVYDLRQSGSGCGGNSDYYIYYMYYANELGYELYLPPTIVHTPVTTAPAGTALKVTADVTDDNSVSQVVLYYLHKGLTDSTSVNMYTETTGSSTFKASIPSDFMTASQLEYYIIATDDEDYTTRLPVKGSYTVTVSATAKQVINSLKTESSALTNKKIIKPNTDIINSSPVAP